MFSYSQAFWFLSAFFFSFTYPAFTAQAAQNAVDPFEEQIQSLDEYVVSDARLPKGKTDFNKIPVKATVITSEDIKKTGAQTVQEALQLATGIVLYDPNGNSFQQTIDLRGFNAIANTGTVILVDGVQINEPDFNQVNFDLIPLETIDRIEILPGPSALYGKNAIAGVVNIITKGGTQKRKVGAEVAFGSFQRERYTINTSGPVGEKVDYFFNFSREQEDGFRDESDAKISRFFGKIGFRPFRGTEGDISYTYVNDRIMQASVLSVAEFYQDRNQTITPGDFTQNVNNFVRFNGRQTLPFGLSAQINAFYRKLDASSLSIFRSGGTSSTHKITESRGGTFQINHEGDIANHSNNLVGGVEYTRNDIDRPVAFIGANNLNEDVFGLYVQNSFHLFPNLILIGGLRFEHDQIGFESQTTPSTNTDAKFRRLQPHASVVFQFYPQASAYFSFTEGFRPPQPDELFGTTINPTLKPAHSQNFEVGLKGQPANWLEFSAALFLTNVKNEIFFTCIICDFSDDSQRNLEKTMRRGFEITIKGRFKELFDSTINYTFVEAQFRSPVNFSATQMVAVGDSLPLVPKNRLTFTGNVYPSKNWTISLNGIYQSARFYRGDSANIFPRLPGYIVVNARVSYARRVPGGTFKTFLLVNNIFNADYFSYGIISSGARFVMPAAPISIFGGIGFEFDGFSG